MHILGSYWSIPAGIITAALISMAQTLSMVSVFALVLASGIGILFCITFISKKTPSPGTKLTHINMAIMTDNAIADCDESLYLLLLQHLCIKEVIVIVLESYEDKDAIISSGAVVNALHVPCVLNDKVIQTIDYALTLTTNNEHVVKPQRINDDDGYVKYTLVFSPNQSGNKMDNDIFRDKSFLSDTPSGMVANAKFYLELKELLTQHVQNAFGDPSTPELNVYDSSQGQTFFAFPFDKKLDDINMDDLSDGDGCHSSYWLHDRLMFMFMSWMNVINSAMNFWNIIVLRLGVAVMVPCPEELNKAWLGRPRNWPSAEVVDAISRMDCHIIMTPKTINGFSHGTPREEQLIWQLRYYRQINYLCAHLHPKVRQCAVVFQTMLQTYLPELLNPQSTYEGLVHIIFWQMEDMTLDEVQQTSRPDMILGLLQRLTDVVENQRLICFFSGRNLIRDTNLYFDELLKGQVLKKLSDISINLSRYVTPNILSMVSINIQEEEKQPYLWLTKI